MASSSWAAPPPACVQGRSSGFRTRLPPPGKDTGGLNRIPASGRKPHQTLKLVGEKRGRKRTLHLPPPGCPPWASGAVLVRQDNTGCCLWPGAVVMDLRPMGPTTPRAARRDVSSGGAATPAPHRPRRASAWCRPRPCCISCSSHGGHPLPPQLGSLPPLTQARPSLQLQIYSRWTLDFLVSLCGSALHETLRFHKSPRPVGHSPRCLLHPWAPSELGAEFPGWVSLPPLPAAHTGSALLSSRRMKCCSAGGS